MRDIFAARVRPEPVPDEHGQQYADPANARRAGRRRACLASAFMRGAEFTASGAHFADGRVTGPHQPGDLLAIPAGVILAPFSWRTSVYQMEVAR